MSDLCKCGHAKDHHFTPRLSGRCFRHECECVAFEAPPADRDDLVAILAKHEPSYQVDGDYGERQWIECTCDSEYFVDTDAGWAEHRAHMAQMVLESDWLRGVRAKELRDAAQQYIERGVMPGSPSNVSLWLIDRADRVDAEDTDNTTDRT